MVRNKATAFAKICGATLVVSVMVIAVVLGISVTHVTDYERSTAQGVAGVAAFVGIAALVGLIASLFFDRNDD